MGGVAGAAVAVITVGKPVVASALGVAVLGETLSVTGPGVIWLIAAVAAVIAATVALARGEAATIAAGAGRDVKITERPRVPVEL